MFSTLVAAPGAFAANCKGASTLSRIAAKELGKDPGAAEKTLRKATAMCPMSAALHHNLALALFMQKKYAASEAQCNVALKLKPDYGRALNTLAKITIEKDGGDPALATEYARRAVALEPYNADFKETLARAKAVSIAAAPAPEPVRLMPELKLEVKIIDPSNNGQLEGSETATLKVKVLNIGRGKAGMVTIKPIIVNSIEGVRFSAAIATINGIEPGRARTLEFKLFTDKRLPTGSLSIVVEASENGGFDADPYQVHISTRKFEPPKLQIADIEIDDQSENGQIEPKEIVDIKVTIRNTSGADAKAVSAMLKLGTDVYATGDSKVLFNLGDIPAGSDEVISFSIYTAKRATAIPVTLELRDSRPEYKWEYPLGLALNMPIERGLPRDEDVKVDDPPVTGIRRPNAVAVVIGNKDYKNNIPRVEFAKRDAGVMSQYLQKTMGFSRNNIIDLRNAGKAEFDRVFGNDSYHKGRLYSIAKAGSEIFVYYSGHGAPDTESRKSYLMPVDADPLAIKLTGYSLETLYKNLEKLAAEKRPKSIVVVLDSCFSGGYNGGSLPITQDASPIFIEADLPLLNAPNSVVISSSGPEQISSWYRDKKHGLFTYFFLKAIKQNVVKGRAVSAGDIERALLDRDAVNDHAMSLYNREQVPQVSGDRAIIILDMK